MVKFKDNSERLQDEFHSQRLDYRIKGMVNSIAGFVEYHFRKDIVITGIERTQAEQDKIYANDKKYQKKPWFSVHQPMPICRGTDLRVWGLTPKQRRKIVKFVNRNFPYNRLHYKSAMIHKVGDEGLHIHLQVKA